MTKEPASAHPATPNAAGIVPATGALSSDYCESSGDSGYDERSGPAHPAIPNAAGIVPVLVGAIFVVQIAKILNRILTCAPCANLPGSAHGRQHGAKPATHNHRQGNCRHEVFRSTRRKADSGCRSIRSSKWIAPFPQKLRQRQLQVENTTNAP